MAVSEIPACQCGTEVGIIPADDCHDVLPDGLRDGVVGTHADASGYQALRAMPAEAADQSSHYGVRLFPASQPRPFG